MFSLIKAHLIAFREDTRGTVTVETAIMLPALFWAWATAYVFFDAYRQASIVQKAAYTVGDMVSRETDYVTDNYITNTKKLYDLMVKSNLDNSIRISVIRYDLANDQYSIDWSKTRGTKVELTTSDVQLWHDKLPVMPDDEIIIYVETWSKFSAPFTVGLENKIFEGRVFTRPRFAPQVLYQAS